MWTLSLRLLLIDPGRLYRRFIEIPFCIRFADRCPFHSFGTGNDFRYERLRLTQGLFKVAYGRRLEPQEVRAAVGGVVIERDQERKRAPVYAPGVKAMSSSAVRLASSSVDVSFPCALFSGSMSVASSELRSWIALPFSLCAITGFAPLAFRVEWISME